LKHLNKQKEGKKRLKKLAGNIDVPQSAFYQVLSARSRPYSTAVVAETLFPVYEPIHPPVYGGDVVLPYIPEDIELPEISSHPVIPASPIPRHAVSPEYRASRLSTLYQLTTLSPERADPNEVWEVYQDLLTSSPDTHTLTPHEIRSVLRFIHTSDRVSNSNTSSERIASALSELRGVLGGNDTQVTELIGVVTQSARRGRKAEADLRNAENMVNALFESVPNGQWTLGLTMRYRSSINHILRICAEIPDSRSFEVWWDKLDVKDSYAWSARIEKSVRTGKIWDVPGVLERAMVSLGKGSEKRIIMLNDAMSEFSKTRRWELVAPAYRLLTGRSEDVDPTLNLPTPLDTPKIEDGMFLMVPDDVKADRQTFQIMLFEFARTGHLAAALTVLSDMFNMDCEPHVNEYGILFKGFSTFGVIPDEESKECYSLFPALERPEPEYVSDLRAISKIWARGILGVDRPLETQGNPWKREILQELFESFIRLRPGEDARNSKAPSPDNVWCMMSAISRVSGGDAKTVWGVWEVMRRKFGMGAAGDEGVWKDWKMNKRLMKVVEGLEDILGGREREKELMDVPETGGRPLRGGSSSTSLSSRKRSGPPHPRHGQAIRQFSLLSTTHIGRAFENHTMAYLNDYLHMSLRRVGGAGDEGIDLTGWWYVPSSSPDADVGARQTKRLRVIVQCKAEAKALNGRAVRELEGVVAHMNGKSAISPLTHTH
jgi:hypothetical protein